jgi:hypothetical protein
LSGGEQWWIESSATGNGWPRRRASEARAGARDGEERDWGEQLWARRVNEGTPRHSPSTQARTEKVERSEMARCALCMGATSRACVGGSDIYRIRVTRRCA